MDSIKKSTRPCSNNGSLARLRAQQLFSKAKIQCLVVEMKNERENEAFRILIVPIVFFFLFFEKGFL